MSSRIVKSVIFIGAAASVLILSFTGAARGLETDEEGTILTLERLCADPPLDGVRLREIFWSPDGRAVGYLRPNSENRDILELWIYDIRSGKSHCAVRAEDLLPTDDRELSEEEIGILERKRITQRGITGYSWEPSGRSLLFPLGGKLFIFDLTTGRSTMIDDGTGGVPLDPRFSPDGSLITFVRGGNLWSVRSDAGEPRQLTSGASETVSFGLAEFIAQEEMDRDRGYWWSGDGRWLAFIEVDESPVEIWHRARYEAEGSRITEQRYPAAGKPNARTRLGILDSERGETRWIDLGPDVEYIARVAWRPNDRLLFVQVQPRDQRQLRVVTVDPRTGATETILTESSDTYVNLHDDLVFLENGSFVWSSENTGVKQLYLHYADGKLIRQLTHHDLPVIEVEGIDESSGNIFYTAVTNRSLEQHLFSQSLSGGEPERLTSSSGWHTIVMSPDGGHYVDTHSTGVSPPRVSLHDATGTRIGTIEPNPTPELGEITLSPPEFLEVTAADGKTPLRAMMIKPPDFDPSRRYPVIVYGYGGPHGHMVRDHWRFFRNLWNQLLAERGYIVFSVDSRGADHRGKRFEDEIFQRFGDVEVADHAAAVSYLRRLPFVDPDRIGIWGWSYGGTLVVLSLLDTEDVYRCGIAVAPVTDWHLYDTHYTERYLGHPDAEPDVYDRASVLSRDPRGLNESLLLVHGMADDNVFLRHTLSLVEELQDAGTQFDLMLYPGKTHLIAGKRTTYHLYGTILDYLENHLKSDVNH